MYQLMSILQLQKTPYVKNWGEIGQKYKIPPSKCGNPRALTKKDKS